MCIHVCMVHGVVPIGLYSTNAFGLHAADQATVADVLAILLTCTFEGRLQASVVVFLPFCVAPGVLSAQNPCNLNAYWVSPISPVTIYVVTLPTFTIVQFPLGLIFR